MFCLIHFLTNPLKCLNLFGCCHNSLLQIIILWHIKRRQKVAGCVLFYILVVFLCHLTCIVSIVFLHWLFNRCPGIWGSWLGYRNLPAMKGFILGALPTVKTSGYYKKQLIKLKDIFFGINGRVLSFCVSSFKYLLWVGLKNPRVVQSKVL